MFSQSCSQAVPSTLRLTTESFSFSEKQDAARNRMSQNVCHVVLALQFIAFTFSFSDFFQGPLLSSGRLLPAESLLSGFNGKVKISTLLSGNRYFRRSRYFRISTVRFRLEENDNFNFRLARDVIFFFAVCFSLSWEV